MSMKDENAELSRILSEANKNPKKASKKGNNPYYDDEDYDDIGKLVQWSTGDGHKFFPTGYTLDELPPGAYEPAYSPDRGYFMHKIEVKTEGLLEFPETNSEKVIEEIKKFWDRENLFKSFGLPHKRGIILWGPPGSGKSCTIQLVMADVVKRGGIAVIFDDPNIFIENIRQVREIQPETPLIVLMEDIDSILDMYNESEVLNILDGVERIEKVVYIATTNYPEVLGERIINRPSRFDRRFKMPPPRAASRKIYFEHLMKGKEELVPDAMKNNLEQWVVDTKGMSIAHLKELFTAVCILGDEYDETIDILRTMVEKKPTSADDDPSKGGMGFMNSGGEDFD